MCYLISAVQYLASSKKLHTHVKKQPEGELNTPIKNLFLKLEEKTDANTQFSILLKYFIKAHPDFANLMEQHDSQEALNALITDLKMEELFEI